MFLTDNLIIQKADEGTELILRHKQGKMIEEVEIVGIFQMGKPVQEDWEILKKINIRGRVKQMERC